VLSQAEQLKAHSRALQGDLSASHSQLKQTQEIVEEKRLELEELKAINRDVSHS
jgi:hypothetical protein